MYEMISVDLSDAHIYDANLDIKLCKLKIKKFHNQNSYC